jgi:hypothetical protein
MMMMTTNASAAAAPVAAASAASPEAQQAAGKRLLRAWRTQYRQLANRQLLEDAERQSVSSAYVRSISFESLTAKLREKPVIASTKALLQRVHLQCTFRHGSPSGVRTPENVNVRVFLAAYMIAYRSTHVFESMGALEHPLLEAATKLLDCFESIVGVLRDHDGYFAAVPHALSEAFPTLLFEYLKCFKAWKVPDEAKLVCRIRHALVALYQAETHLPPDEPEDSRLKVEFRTQIERLRSKLQQISGADALAQFDADREANVLPVAPAAAQQGGYAALPGRMTNEQLAHELLLDPTFQLDESGGCGLENAVFDRIRASFHQAFWDSLADDLRLATPCYVRVLRVLAEIRDGINDLAGNRETANLAEAVDLDLIKQQAEAGAYDWMHCRRLVRAVVEMVQRMQSPRRDEETAGRWAALERRMLAAAPVEHPAVFCAALEFLLDRVNAMRIDAANARLRLISPVIRDHGIDYERGKFQDKLNDGSLTLERTTAWVGEAVRQVVDGREVELDALLNGRAEAFVRVHSAAMVRLVTSMEHRAFPSRADTAPETLLFDVHRIGGMQIEFHYLTMAATVLLATAPSLAAVPEVRAQVEAAVVAHRPEATDQSVLTEAIEAALAPLDEAPRRVTQCVVHQSTSPTDPVRRLLEMRLRALVVRVMRDGRLPADLRAFAQARALLPRVEMLATRLLALCNLNRTVHLPTYNLLIGQAALERSAAAGAVVVPERAPKRGHRAVA